MSPPTAGTSAAELVPDLERLRSVKVVGLGGVGGIASRYTALWLGALAAESRVVLIDGDVFEAGNATRMLFSRCGNKAAVLRDDLLEELGPSSVLLTAIEEYVTHENLPRLIRDGDVVLLAVDNHTTRKLVADHCASLDEVCLVSGGNDGVGADAGGTLLRGTYGNVQIQLRRGGQDVTPRLDAFHPEIAQPRDKHPDELSCTEAIASVPQILFANLATASALLNALFLYACDALHYGEVCFDIADGRMQPIPLPGRSSGPGKAG